MSEQLEEKVEVYEKQLHCDGHAGADGPHHDAKEETGRGEDDAHDAHNLLCIVAMDPGFNTFLSWIIISVLFGLYSFLPFWQLCHLCFEAKQGGDCIF